MFGLLKTKENFVKMSEICRNIELILSIIVGVIFLALCLFMAIGQYIIMIQDWSEKYRKRKNEMKDKKSEL